MGFRSKAPAFRNWTTCESLERLDTIFMQTVTDYTYEGITLLELVATQGQESWRLSYLYDEEGTPYGAIYREGTGEPLAIALVTKDRGDVVALLDAAGDSFASYRYDAWGSPQGAGSYSTADRRLLPGSQLRRHHGKSTDEWGQTA